MTHYLIDVHDVTHTCPAGPEPHAIDTRRRIVTASPAGPCLSPVTVRLAGINTVVACGRRRPAAQQCDACLTTITIRSHTTEHHGPVDPCPAAQTPPTGLAHAPCQTCGQPPAAALTRLGRHLLCRPPAHPMLGDAA